MSDFDVLPIFNVRSVKLDLMVNVVIYLAQFYVI